MQKILLNSVILLILLLGCTTTRSPLEEISRSRDFRTMRLSSSDPDWENGNRDGKQIPAGTTLLLGELPGPGRIAHIWFTTSNDREFYGKLLVLRMYWDGESYPSVECPLNDFFCEGHGLDVYVNSLPFRVTSDGRGRNCYWPMPFARSARITLTNESNVQINAFYYYIDWQKMDVMPRDELFFHASYRQEYPCTQGQDYLVFEAEGRGHYVGCNLSVRQQEASWWGEGDDRFYIDGEAVPSLLGTGSEDYFCDGWGIRLLDGLFYGFPISEGSAELARHTCYRFHIYDPVTFKKSIRMTFEHKGARYYPDGTFNYYVERADDFSSVAYWYQTEPHKPFPPLPVGEERLYDSNTLVMEGESLVETALWVGPAPVVQNLTACSGGAQMFFTPGSLPAAVTVTFPVVKDGNYTLQVKLLNSYDYGIYRIFLDGVQLGAEYDLYNKNIVYAKPINLGSYEFTAGQHRLRFEASSKNSASAGYFFGLDYVGLILDN